MDARIKSGHDGRVYGLLRRFAPRNDGKYRRDFATPRRDAPESLMKLSPKEQRAWGMPGA